MNLYLVRHGITLSTANAEQTLSEMGIQQTQKIGRFLKQSGVEIDEILHSEKWRAKQTAQIIGKIVAPDLTLTQSPGLKPDDPIEPVVHEIATFDRNVMLISHLPFLEKLLTTLILGTDTLCPVDFCGTCVVCLQGTGHIWQIAWVISPQLVHSLD